MEVWIELEDAYLTDQPMVYRGKGRGSKRVPDPDHPPKEAWLFTYNCQRRARGIKRSRCMVTLKAKTPEELAEKIERFATREAVVLIASPHDPLKYAASKCEPEPLHTSASAEGQK